MTKWRIVTAVVSALALLTACLFIFRIARRPPMPQTRNDEGQTSNVSLVPTQAPARGPADRDPFVEKLDQLKAQAAAGFDTVCKALRPYSGLGQATNSSVALRTNRQGSVNVEIWVVSTTHIASFVAGPLSHEGRHVNPFAPDGALLGKLTSLRDSSDTRDNPEAMNSWYQASGTWSEDGAVRETLRLMEELGIPTNQVVRHRFHATPLTVSDPSGTKVGVTPFYSVQMCKSSDNDYSYFLSAEYRMGDAPPGKVTDWYCWPPIKIR